MAKKASTERTLTVNGREIPVRDCLRHQADLRFYPENPRIHSFVFAEGNELSQDEIEKKLCQLDHVKQLVQSIVANDGLLDPLIVREGDNVVLEGNSRLAAYRLLNRGNAIKWGEVKCALLPSDISEDLVFALLGEYHIIGRKDWAPYEQAGFLWRRNKRHSVLPETMAKEMGLSVKAINHLIEVYSFMVEHEQDDPQRWSYYDEYLKSRAIKQVRDDRPEFDEVIVGKIGSGEIAKATDVRDKVVKIASVKGKRKSKILRDFVDTPGSLDACYEQALEGGASNVLLKRLTKFRTQIADPDTKKELHNMAKAQLDQCKFELRKIEQRVGDLLKDL